jgi:acetyl esterase
VKANPVLDSVESQRGADLDPNVREFIRITGEAYVVHGKDRPKTIESAREVAERVRAPWPRPRNRPSSTSMAAAG